MQITGYDVYRILTSLRIHFTTKDYHFERGLITPKLETYYSDRFYEVYEGLSRYDEDYIIGLYVSNCLHSNGFVQVVQLKNKTAHKIKEKWEESIETIDQQFCAEFILLMDKCGFDNPFQLFEKIKKSVEKQETSDVVAVKDIMEVIDDKLEYQSGGNNEFLIDLMKESVNFLFVLNLIMTKYYDYSFLQSFITNNPTLSEHPFLFAYKYQCLMDCDDIMKMPKIKMFCECLN